MKNIPDEDEQFRALLAGQMPSLPDKDFSRKVMQCLPKPRRSYRHFVWPLAGVVAGLGFAISRSGLWSTFGQNGAQWSASFGSAITALANPWILLAMAVTGLSLLIAYAFNRGNVR